MCADWHQNCSTWLKGRGTTGPLPRVFLSCHRVAKLQRTSPWSCCCCLAEELEDQQVKTQPKLFIQAAPAPASWFWSGLPTHRGTITGTSPGWSMQAHIQALFQVHCSKASNETVGKGKLKTCEVAQQHLLPPLSCTAQSFIWWDHLTTSEIAATEKMQEQGQTWPLRGAREGWWRCGRGKRGWHALPHHTYCPPSNWWAFCKYVWSNK